MQEVSLIHVTRTRFSHRDSASMRPLCNTSRLTMDRQSALLAQDRRCGKMAPARRTSLNRSRMTSNDVHAQWGKRQHWRTACIPSILARLSSTNGWWLFIQSTWGGVYLRARNTSNDWIGYGTVGLVAACRFGNAAWTPGDI